MNMIEKVARAIQNCPYPAMNIDKAKAAIAAMREPTAEMLTFSSFKSADDLYPAEEVYINLPNDHKTLEKLEQSIKTEVGCNPEELTGVTPEMLGVDLGMDNGTKTVLNFQDGNKRRSIDVIIVGDLALDYDDDGWNIYHVPTGTVFTKAVPAWNKLNGEEIGYEPSELLAWMKKVQEKHDVSWTMLRLLTPDNYNDKGDSAKRIIKEWCLSVPVKE